jgi:hypothetical protein
VTTGCSGSAGRELGGGGEFFEQFPDATFDVVADDADVFGSLAGGVFELPVDVALAGM